MQLKKASSKGFTMLEILIASMVVAIGFAGNYALMTHSLRQHSFGLHLSRAAHITASVGEELRAAGALTSDLERRCAEGEVAACRSQAWQLKARTRWQQYCDDALPKCAITITIGTRNSNISVSWQQAFELSRQTTSIQIGHE
ncbi:MAG: prepilin-type N-terminal cleavage/methylation domain-containing protein [Pseudomonadota bacterium]